MIEDDEFVKVPYYVEADDSKTFFLPDCKYIQKEAYQIGKRGKNQQYVSDYWAALSILMTMEKPYFRRKNRLGSNMSGTIGCEPGDIEEVRKAYIEAERVKYGG